MQGKQLPKRLSIYPNYAKNRLLNIEGVSINRSHLTDFEFEIGNQICYDEPVTRVGAGTNARLASIAIRLVLGP